MLFHPMDDYGTYGSISVEAVCACVSLGLNASFAYIVNDVATRCLFNNESTRCRFVGFCLEVFLELCRNNKIRNRMMHES